MNSNLIKSVSGAIFVVLIIFGAAWFLFKGKENSQPSYVRPPGPTRVINEINLSAEGFYPATINIKPNQVITWVNKSGKAARISFDANPLTKVRSLAEFETETSVSTKFENSGTYTYFNYLLPEQKGTLIVE